MIRLGLRLALTGWTAKLIAAASAVGVAAGTAIVLFALALLPATSAREDRVAWLDAVGRLAPVDSEPAGPATWFGTSVDYIGSATVTVATVSAATDVAAMPPGIPTLPTHGEAYLSPALADLLDTTHLARGRYGDVIGTIGDVALASPDDLVAIRGLSSAEAASAGGMLVTGFNGPSSQTSDIAPALALFAVVGTVAVLVPTGLFVASATRLAAASRDRRLAALQLAGAAPSQVRALAIVESLVTGVCGVLLGMVLFLLLRPGVARISFDGGSWHPADLDPGVPVLLAVGAAVPTMVALASSVTLRRVLRSSLDVSRQAPAKPLRSWRLVPAAAAAAAVGVTVFLSEDVRESLGGSGDRVVAASFALVFVAVALAGPWITRLLGNLLARCGNAAAVLAGRHLAAEPRGGFRAVAGIVFAVLALSAFVTITPAAAQSLDDTRVTGIEQGTGQANVGSVEVTEAGSIADTLRDQPGIDAVTSVHTGGVGNLDGSAWFGSCTEIVKATGWSKIPCGAAPVLVASGAAAAALAQMSDVEVNNLRPAQSEPLFGPREHEVTTAMLPLKNTAEMPPQPGVDVPAIIVDTDLIPNITQDFRPDLLVLSYTNANALEQARTAVVEHIPYSTIMTRQTTFEGFSADVRALYETATVVTTVIVAMATVSLVISVAIGLLQRRLPFALLRAAGTPVRTLRLTMLLEAGIPLFALTAISLMLGHSAGRWIATSTGSTALPTPMELLQPAALTLTVATAVILAAVPLVKKATDTNRVRFE